MEGVTQQFRRLTMHEGAVLDKLASEVNPAAIFSALWVYYAVEADLDLGRQGPEYQKVMRTLEEACRFVREVIQADWGDDEDSDSTYTMEPHCCKPGMPELRSLSQLIEAATHHDVALKEHVLWVARAHDMITDSRFSEHRDKLFSSAVRHLELANKAINAEWEKILSPPFDYHAYLRSPEWKVKRDAQVEAAGGRCQVCNSRKQLNCHHRTYERIGNELPEDLFVLCAECHVIFHENGRLARP